MENIFGNQSTVVVVYVVALIGIMYFLMIRPQQKQAKARNALLSSIRPKDKVVTAGGIYGKVIKVKEDSVILQIAEKVEVEVAKTGITSIENRKAEAEEPKTKKNNKEIAEESKSE